MFNQPLTTLQELPIPDRNRKSTDVICTIIGAIFALIMFIFACIYFSQGQVNKHFYNWGTNGSQCGNQFIQYTNSGFNSISCVSSCQNGFLNINGYCQPNDPSLRQAFMNNPQLSQHHDYYGLKKTLFWTAVIALSLGLLWMTFVHFLPRMAPLVAIVLAVILLLICGILACISNTGFFNSGWKIVVAIILFLLAIIITVMGCSYSNQLRMQGIFLAYANHFLHDSPFNFLYIPLALLFTVGLLALFIFQHAAFASKFGSTNIFFDFGNPGFWGVLNCLEFIWAFQFLRDAFNFIISGNAVDWYWGNYYNSGQQGGRLSGQNECSSFNRLLCRNWGSVVGGSFLNAFFQIPTLIAELLICHPGTCCNKAGTICLSTCNCCTSIFSLVRTDVYSYINLTGQPYCNSARECANLCGHHGQFVGEFSPMKHYRFIAHVFLVTLISLLGYLICKVRVINIGFWHAVCIIVVAYIVVTWFIDIHADAAEGIQTSFFAQHAADGYQYMQHAYPSYRKEIQHRANRANSIRDGNC